MAGDWMIGWMAVLLDLALLPSFADGRRPSPWTACGYALATFVSGVGFAVNGQWFPAFATGVGMLEWMTMFVLAVWMRASRAA